jgi:1,4-dihydroxy-2-naphthoyl-CoA hydrolase
MRIWKHDFTVEAMNTICTDTIASHIGIEYVDFGDDWLKARMPVDSRTVQPARILHGGASVVLAESIGSMASFLCTDPESSNVVGLEINANHIRPVTSGYVYGEVHPIHLGRTTHVWDIRIKNEEGKLVCICRLTVAIIAHR